jgi:hypothetical protein
MLAISGNEMSFGHHRGSFLNDFSHSGFFLRFAFFYIKYHNGLSIFNHPGRYNYEDEWYQKYLNIYDNVILGIEVYNQGDRYNNDRLLWDRLNKEREPNNLIWGFSNDDMHHITSHAFRNYQHLIMNNLTEKEFRKSMIEGAFYFSYEPEGSNTEETNYGIAKTPKLINVIINNTMIEIIGENVENIKWYNENSQIICEDYTIDISIIDSNFVRAVLKNENGLTYTQPFGLEQS